MWIWGAKKEQGGLWSRRLGCLWGQQPPAPAAAPLTWYLL